MALTFRGIVSCTYTRPIVSVRTNCETKKDSITNNIVKEKSFKYLSFHRLAIIGQYNKRIELDSIGNKIRIIQSKKTPAYIFDGRVRYYRKEQLFDSNGNIIQVNKRIFQSQGRGGRTVIDKTIIYKNGKKIRLNNKKKNNG
jgi:hypothetical protein